MQKHGVVYLHRRFLHKTDGRAGGRAGGASEGGDVRTQGEELREKKAEGRKEGGGWPKQRQKQRESRRSRRSQLKPPPQGAYLEDADEVSERGFSNAVLLQKNSPVHLERLPFPRQLRFDHFHRAGLRGLFRGQGRDRQDLGALR